jgi:hypothetical protein
MDDSTFNLTALSERLFAEKRLKPFAGKIKRAKELASMHADLMMACECLDALDVSLAVPSASNDMSRSITEASLLSNAVVLYARATKAKSDERKDCDLRAKFSPDQKVVHRELCDLRDKAIAHFGSGGSYAGEWKVELVVLDVTDEGARVAVATRRKTVDKKLVQRARTQIETARALLSDLAKEKIDEVTEELKLLVEKDADLINKEIHRHPLNFSVFLTSPEAAATARSGRDKGYVKGVVRHGG